MKSERLQEIEEALDRIDTFEPSLYWLEQYADFKEKAPEWLRWQNDTIKRLTEENERLKKRNEMLLKIVQERYTDALRLLEEREGGGGSP